MAARRCRPRRCLAAGRVGLAVDRNCVGTRVRESARSSTPSPPAGTARPRRRPRPLRLLVARPARRAAAARPADAAHRRRTHRPLDPDRWQPAVAQRRQ
ncbi:hypothetical protein G6F54_014334 [Rhizopus delemar]|nr:hypothetical protein G6F54_014334 [Rhizopus delemar]